MPKYHYQCASCGCTLFAEALQPGENWIYVMNGQLCSQCQIEIDSENQMDDYDDYDE